MIANRKTYTAHNGRTHILQPNNKFRLDIRDKPRTVEKYNFQTGSASCSVSNVKCLSMLDHVEGIEGGQCSTSGLALIYKWQKMELRQKICQPDRLYQQYLPLNATLISILWTTNYDSHLDCLVWCS